MLDAENVLEEYLGIARNSSADPGLQAVSTAIFLEETFGVVLRDDDIDPVVLGTVPAIQALLTRLGVS